MAHEFFDHTADIGIRGRGATLAELYASMAQGLVELIAEDSPLQPVEARPIDLSAPDAEVLLLRWLKELLFWFSTDRFLPVRYEWTEATSTRLRARVWGDVFDPAQHTQGREVKAITRHALAVRHDAQGWTGEVIVDI
jgi:SHS2 domain-containing protein